MSRRTPPTVIKSIRIPKSRWESLESLAHRRSLAERRNISFKQLIMNAVEQAYGPELDAIEKELSVAG